MRSKRTLIDRISWQSDVSSGTGARLSYADRSHGGRSSARLERQVVALEVGGSSPLGHPIVVMVVRREAGDHRSGHRPDSAEKSDQRRTVHRERSGRLTTHKRL